MPSLREVMYRIRHPWEVTDEHREALRRMKALEQRADRLDQLMREAERSVRGTR